MLRSRSSDYGTYSSRLGPERDIASALEGFIAMVILMALAAAIRFWKLGAWSFWADEVLSVQDAQRFPAVIKANPIIYIIIRAVTDNLGISEWSARLAPCIIGIISIPVLYWLARRIFDEKVGLIACLFLVIHPWHIYWSQNARAYSLAFLFASAAACLFYIALERDSFFLILASLVSTVLAILSYSHTVLLLPALAVYVFLLMFLPVDIPRGLNGRNVITFFAPFALALLLLLSSTVRSYIYSGWGSNGWGRSPLYILFTLVYGLGVPIAVSSLVGGLHSLVYMNKSGLFLICFAVVPLASILIISMFLNVAGYYLFFTVPAYLLLSAFCASELMDNASRKSKVLATAVIMTILVSSISQDYLYFKKENGGRPQWREAFQTLKNRIGNDDIVVTSMPQVAEYYMGEFSSVSASEALPYESQLIKLDIAMAQLGSLENFWRWQDKRVWFVLDQPCLEVQDADHKFREWLHANCRMVEEFPVYARVMDRTISIWRFTTDQSNR